jgi:hypothetical protein
MPIGALLPGVRDAAGRASSGGASRLVAVPEPVELAPFDAIAAWLVDSVKSVILDGARGELSDEDYADVRALSTEHLDEEALLRLAREELDVAMRPVMRKVLRRALDDINREP